MSRHAKTRERSSSMKVCHPSEVIFIKGCLPSNDVFHQRSSSIRSHLQSKVVFHQSSSSINSPPPSIVAPWRIGTLKYLETEIEKWPWPGGTKLGQTEVIIAAQSFENNVYDDLFYIGKTCFLDA